MRTDPRAVALVTLALTGCSTLCKGPGCADAYEIGRISVLSWNGDRLRNVDAWEDVDYQLQGFEVDGTDWVVIPAGGGDMWIGMPQANQVVRAAIDPDSKRVRPTVTITGSGAFGYSLARVDVDGDGTRDLLVGAPEDDFSAGAVYVFSNPPTERATPISSTDPQVVAIRGNKASERFGEAIVPCADLTGDEQQEIAITIPRYDLPSSDPVRLPGAVAMLLSEELVTASPDEDYTADQLGRIWWGDKTGDGAGRSVACRHDLTGDRRADVAIGAPAAGDLDAGVVYVIETNGVFALLGGEALPDNGSLGDLPGVISLGTTRNEAWFGTALTTLELDGEPPFDLVIGAPGAHQGSGRVEVYRGIDVTSRTPSARWAIRNEPDSDWADHFGRQLAGSDLDDDGVDDLIVGVPDWHGGGNLYDAGHIYVWSGAKVQAGSWPASFLTADSADLEVVGSQPFQRVGRRMEGFDADGDGTRDLVFTTRGLTPD